MQPFSVFRLERGNEEMKKMKSRMLTISLCFVAILFAVGLLFAETDVDGPITSTGSITKDSGQVRAHASANASNAAKTGWFWIHAQVLPYNTNYQDVDSDPIHGYFYRSVYVSRGGQPKSNGRAYSSIWAMSAAGYHSPLVDLP